MTDPPLIQIRGLRFRYDGAHAEVLNIPGLDVAGRGLTAITGPSGVGKSTLVELIAGTLRGPYEGSVVVLGQEWKTLVNDAQRQRQIRRIGLIPQDYGLLADRTPAQMLDQDLSDAGVNRDQRSGRITSALTAVGLLDCHDRLIAGLSGGQRQRVAIARMLARDVELVIADEPTANLDPALTVATMDTFRTLAARVPVVVITHDPTVAAACDRTILLQGAAQATSPPGSATFPSPGSVLPHHHLRRFPAVLAGAATLTIAAGIALGVVLTHHAHSADAGKSSTAVSHPAAPPASTTPATSPSTAATPGLVPFANRPITTMSADSAPLNVVYRYYDAINARNWRSVWELGGDNLGETYSTMVAGYAHTADDIPYIGGITGDNVDVMLLAYEDSGLAQVYSSSLQIHAGAITEAQQVLVLTDRSSGFGALAGDWGGHDRDLQITPGGIGVMSYRTFKTCHSIESGCDRFVGNQIINGGLTIFRLTGGQGLEAEGHIYSSNTGFSGPLTMVEDPETDSLELPGGARF
jgi:putative ABC transport system ATP-binding protein